MRLVRLIWMFRPVANLRLYEIVGRGRELRVPTESFDVCAFFAFFLELRVGEIGEAGSVRPVAKSSL